MLMAVSWAVSVSRPLVDSQALMLRDASQRWVASAITGEVTPRTASWQRLLLS